MDESVSIVARLLAPETLVLIVGGAITIVAIISTSVSGMVRAAVTERTRREIAAYIAEGSMTPDQGERLMKAGKAPGESA